MGVVNTVVGGVGLFLERTGERLEGFLEQTSAEHTSAHGSQIPIEAGPSGVETAASSLRKFGEYLVQRSSEY